MKKLLALAAFALFLTVATQAQTNNTSTETKKEAVSKDKTSCQGHSDNKEGKACCSKGNGTASEHKEGCKEGGKKEGCCSKDQKKEGGCCSKEQKKEGGCSKDGKKEGECCKKGEKKEGNEKPKK